MNHAAVSPMSTRVVDALHNYIDIRSEGIVDPYRQNVEKANETRDLIAQLINAPVDRIGLVKNTSTGFNILATGLDWKKGDHVILNDMEFPSNVYPFLNLERLGVEVEFVKSRNGRVVVEDVIDAMRPETVIVSVSHVQFLNGYRIELEPLGSVCRERGIIFSVDAIQSAGAIELDVEKQSIDFISSGGHKWLMGPMATGFIYLSQAVQDRISPAYVGWLSVKDAWNFFDYRLDLLDSAERFEVATENWMGLWGFCESVRLLLEVGTKRAEEKVLSLTDRLADGLMERGHEVVSPRGDGEKSGIVLFSAGESKEENEAIFHKLMDRNIHISFREGYLRCSPHFYNTEEEIEKLIEEIG
jgi:selenocysteine lyase/cysteine desulfurase